MKLHELRQLILKNIDSITLLVANNSKYYLANGSVIKLRCSLSFDALTKEIILEFRSKNIEDCLHSVRIDQNMKSTSIMLKKGFDDELFKLLNRSYNIEKILL